MGREILFVDDEENIINSLIRLFRNEDYKVHTALGGQAGLNIIKEHDISLIISDHRMPSMSGVEFLSKAKEIAPDTIRIMLTGYADLESTIAAINEGEVFRFINKPWNDEDLLMTVRQSLDYLDLLSANNRLTKTVKKQAYVIKKLEDNHPGITSILRDDHGAVIIDEEAMGDTSLDEILHAMED